MKFGKHIQKRQLEIPEYAAHFVDYKALKKLIKALSTTPVLAAQNDTVQNEPLDPRVALQANKATFFFRLERELEKVNAFYLLKEAELKLRLTSLLNQKRLMQGQHSPVSKQSSRYIALEEGFRQFSSDLSKLQQFVEINATAFSKILKKWDKTSKSDEKVVYLSRAVEVQPCFNRDIISDLSDQATTNLLDFAAWADGEKISYVPSESDRDVSMQISTQDDADLDAQILQAVTAGNLAVVQDWADRIRPLTDASQRISRIFLATAVEAPDEILKLLLDTESVNVGQTDDINHRNLLHKAAISGRMVLLKIGLMNGVDVRAADVYGRIPLHYACMHGVTEMVSELLAAGPDTVDFKDHDNFTPLIHSIVKSNLSCVEVILTNHARIDPLSEAEHIPLNLACQHGSLPVVELLLRAQPQILPDAEGLYPQHLVARSSSNPQLLLLLQSYGANLDQPDKLYNWTPIFHAASEGNVPCLRALLECGVNTDIPDEKGLSALYYATWEGHIDCIKLLEPFRRSPLVDPPSAPTQVMSTPLPPPVAPSATPGPMSREMDNIPLFALPPPILPVRRYGHNFLENKTFVIIKFGDKDGKAIQFYDDNKYPAARITVSSKSSDLIPRNILLPVQDDSKAISFQIDNLDTFSIDFDIYPTFGAKVIARAVVSSPVFTDTTRSSDAVHLELLDPRLRAIGRINFSFLVVKPFQGTPLEITHFSTYWKATKQTDTHPGALIAGSSLSGDYVRLFVQNTQDGIPVIFPTSNVRIDEGLEIPVNFLTYSAFTSIGTRLLGGQEIHTSRLQALSQMDNSDMRRIYDLCAGSFASLQDVLTAMPPHVHIELHILYPRSSGPPGQPQSSNTADVNAFTDSILRVVFDHARTMRNSAEGFQRSIVFSSFNPDACTALNWKQPNYPVLLCDALGVEESRYNLGPSILGSGGALSVKEAVQLARTNNFMGLMCSWRLLELAPALVESIKTAGLVLVSDLSGVSEAVAQRIFSRAPGLPDGLEGIDGTLRGDAVLRFNDSVDM